MTSLKAGGRGHGRRCERRLFLIPAILVLVAAGCGDDEGTDQPTTTTTAESSTTTAPPSGGEEEGATPTTAPEPEPPVTGLSGLMVVDDRTFTVELVTADAEFPLQLSYAAFFPMPSAFFDDPVGYEESPVGNGPFQMDGTWDHDVEIRTVPYPDYVGTDAADVDSLTFGIYQSLDTAFLDVRAGNLDIVRRIPVDQIATAPDEFGDRYGETPLGAIIYYGFPTYLDDTYTPEARKALSMAVDRQLLIDAILAGTRTPAQSAIPTSIAGSREFVCDNWAFDPQQARQMWDSIDPPQELSVWYVSGSNAGPVAEAVVNQWAQNLGIDPATVTFEQLEFAEYLPLMDNQGFTGVFAIGWGQDYPSPLNFLEPLYASSSFPPAGANAVFYADPVFDQLLAEGKSAVAATGTLDGAIPFYQQAEELLCEDARILPLYFETAQYVWSEEVDNVTVDAFGNINYTSVTGGDVRLEITEPEHLNPLTSNESEGLSVLRALFAPLVDYDPFTGEPFFEMAEAITSNDNGQTWTVAIKDGYTFHDGEPVTAQSFVDAWNYGADGANAQQNNSFYQNIVGYAELNPS